MANENKKERGDEHNHALDDTDAIALLPIPKEFTTSVKYEKYRDELERISKKGAEHFSEEEAVWVKAITPLIKTWEAKH